VFNIPRNITQTLDVDLFFSLFFVFLNEDIEEISTDFTVFAPAGLDTAEAARWLGKKEQVTQQLLLNHIVVGVHLRPELLITATGPWKTLGGHEVEVEVDNRGEFIVNGVRVLAWTKEGPALIVVLEDYLFKQEVAEDTKDSDKNLARLSDVSSENVKNNNAIEATSEFPEAKPRMTEKNCNKVGSLSIFERVTICTETVEDWEDTEMDDKEPETRTRNLPLQGLLEKV